MVSMKVSVIYRLSKCSNKIISASQIILDSGQSSCKSNLCLLVFSAYRHFYIPHDSSDLECVGISLGRVEINTVFL